MNDPRGRPATRSTPRRVWQRVRLRGRDIYPREIEDLLIAHPAVLDVAVVGTPDAEMGEQVTAFVQLVPGSETPTGDLAVELIEYCRAHLAHFKCPREVRVVDELPRLPTGKLLKRLLQ